MKKLGIYVFGCILALLLFAGFAQAQETPSGDEWGPAPAVEPAVVPGEIAEQPAEELISVQLRTIDISEALRALKAIRQDFNFSVDPSITGKVTVSLNNVTFNAALRAVLDQVKATYRQEGGIYYIIPTSAVETISSTMPAITAPKKLKVVEVRFASAGEMAYLFGGTASGATGGFGNLGNNNSGGYGNTGNTSSNTGNNYGNNSSGRNTSSSNRNTSSSSSRNTTSSSNSNNSSYGSGGGYGGGRK